MRVDIGPYKDDIIPVNRWEGYYERMRAKMLGINEWDFGEEHYRWYDLAVISIFNRLWNWAIPLNRWGQNRKRDIEVVIDDYDVWSADHTLALIILPVLQRLKEKKNGSPFVDDADVPEELRSTSAPPKENEWDTDENHDKRWVWALDEMIWAFEQHTDINGDWEDQYIYNSDQLEITFVPVKDQAFKNHSEMKVNNQKDPSKPAYFRDEEAIKKHADRMQHGRILFAKYYAGLWD